MLDMWHGLPARENMARMAMPHPESMVLRPDGCAVASADGAPITRMLGQREFRGEALVNVNAEAWGFVYIHVAFFDGGTAREHLSCLIAEAHAFLYPEVRDRQIEVRIGRVPNGRDVAGTVPRGAHIEPFT